MILILSHQFHSTYSYEIWFYLRYRNVNFSGGVTGSLSVCVAKDLANSCTNMDEVQRIFRTIGGEGNSSLPRKIAQPPYFYLKTSKVKFQSEGQTKTMFYLKGYMHAVSEITSYKLI